MNKLTDQIQAEVNKVVLGKEDIVRKVLLAILAQGHVLLEDVPGVGKTTMALAFARTLGLDSRLTVITVIAASAPPAALMSMFSAKFKLDTALASSMVSVQTAFSALTMPLMVSLASYLA